MELRNQFKNFLKINYENNYDAIRYDPHGIKFLKEHPLFKPVKIKHFLNEFPKVKRGVFNLNSLFEESVSTPNIETERVENKNFFKETHFIPKKREDFVSWGNSNILNKIIESRKFYPVFISGLSGNGKTYMVEQSCAINNRGCVRIQITAETDEDDLIGGFRLLNGETIFHKGPVIVAMETGSILLIDELDRATNNIMCLQGIMEGNPYLIKKIGKLIHPAPGFNIIATGNTKGQGSDDGTFISANILDSAFLERFAITLYQPFPPKNVEEKILKNAYMSNGLNPNEHTTFTNILLEWVKNIRNQYNDGGIDETISTRRLCHIVQTFSIFKDEDKAVQMCISRYDDDVSSAMYNFYKKHKRELSKEDERFMRNETFSEKAA